MADDSHPHNNRLEDVAFAPDACSESDPDKQDGVGSSCVCQYSEANMIKALTKFIVQSELSLSFGKSYGFVRFVQTCSVFPSYKGVPKKIIKKEVSKLYREYKQALISTLSQLRCRVSISCHYWTTEFGLGFVCVTAYFVDDDWVAQKRILSFVECMPRYSTSLDIFLLISKTLRDYGLQSKVLSISFDDACYDAAAIDMLKSEFQPVLDGKFFGVRCPCHYFNLFIDGCLKTLLPIVEKIGDGVSHIQFHGNAPGFAKLCVEKGKVYKKRFAPAITDNWSSVYSMLQSVAGFEDVISIYCNQSSSEISVTETDWEAGKLVRDFLETLHTATCCSDTSENSLLFHLLNMRCFFNKYRNGPGFADIIAPMESKFKDYLQHIDALYWIHLVIDPNIRLCGVEYLFNEIMPVNDGTSLLEEVKNLVYSMFSIYIKGEDCRVRALLAEKANSSKQGGTAKILAMLRKKRPQDYDQSLVPTELDLFLRTDFACPPNDEDVLSWWKSTRVGLVVVAAMARDLLAASKSMLTSKVCFGAKNKVLNETRSRTNDRYVKMCVCLKDWLDAELGVQEQGEEDDFDLEFDEEELKDLLS